MKYTTDYYISRVKEAVGEEYSVIGEYVDYNHTKIKMRHNICGYEYDILPSSFLRGTRCAKCAGLLKYTTATFSDKVKELVGNEYTVLGEYKGNKVKIKMRHEICGYEYDVKPNSFLSGGRCPNCAKNKPYTDTSFKLKVQELVGNEYTVVGEYINSKTSLTMRHNKCGKTFEVIPSVFLSGHRCPHCFKSIPYTTEEYKEKVYALVGDKYSVIGEYKNANTDIELQHNVCGTRYSVKPLMFFVGNRCPSCSANLKRSLPEAIVAYFVSKYFVIEQNYRPKWLQYETGQKGELDIWIPSLKIGIEYDGKFHNSRANNDIYKNSIITNSDECNGLIRLREKGTFQMNIESPKVQLIEAQKPIAITSHRGIPELEQMIRQLLKKLGVEEFKVSLTDDIIELCRNSLEQNYIDLGKPIRSKNQKTRKSNTEEFKQRVFSLVNDEYTILSEYTTALDNIRIRHNLCGYEYDVRPNSFLSGRRCPQCANKIPYNTKSFTERVKKEKNNQYTVLGEYKTSREKVLVKHVICGSEFEVRPYHFLHKDYRCPFCKVK